jgi:thiol-disulfide isomerase/thioredoxin
MYSIFLFLLFVQAGTCAAQNGDPIRKYSFVELEPLLHNNNDTTYIINFWATWCIPCRKELPVFERIHLEYQNQPVKVLLVSLDFPGEIASSLIPFLKKNNITADVVLLNDPNSNSWINKIDSSWTGSIPATLVYNKKSRAFYEKDFDYETLNKIILTIL